MTRNIGIIGAGMIGNTMAALCGMSNIPCTVLVRSEEKAEAARTGLEGIFADMVDHGIATSVNATACASKVSYVTDYAELANCDMIFEAIAENIDVKRECFTQIASNCPNVQAIGSCSSALSPNALAEAAGPLGGKVLVTHPFFPSHMVTYVEVCAADNTEETAVKHAWDTLLALHRHPVMLKKPNPGFIGNYLQFALWAAALKLVEDGVCEPQDIDDCLRYSLGTRYSSIGIFEHFDNGGYKLNATTCDNVFPSLPRYDQAPAIVREKAESPDAWGAKSPTQRGFYDWSQVDMPAYRERVEAPWRKFIDWELPTD